MSGFWVRFRGTMLKTRVNFGSGSKTAVTWGSVRAFPLVSSTPMNGLEMTLAPHLVVCHGGMQRSWAVIAFPYMHVRARARDLAAHHYHLASFRSAGMRIRKRLAWRPCFTVLAAANYIFRCPARPIVACSSFL